MKNTVLKLAGSLALLTLFAGCVEHKTALCTEDNGIEIEGLAGTKTFRTSVGGGEVSEQPITLTYLGNGKYESEQTQSRACRVGRYMALESTTKSGGYSISLIERLGENGFLMSFPVIDKADLEAAGIPYEIVEADLGEEMQVHQALRGLADDDGSVEVLQIHNTTDEQTESLRELYQPGSFGLSLR